MKYGAKSLIGFTMDTNDGELGKVRGFYFDDITLTIRYLIVDTSNWFSTKKELISPRWIIDVKWLEYKVIINHSKDEVKNSSEYDS